MQIRGIQRGPPFDRKRCWSHGEAGPDPAGFRQANSDSSREAFSLGAWSGFRAPAAGNAGCGTFMMFRLITEGFAEKNRGFREAP